MKNEFILFFIKCPKTDYQRCKAETERIDNMFWVHHLSEKHTIPEHFDYRIKRICHECHFDSFYLNIQSIKLIDDGGHIKQKHAEYFVKIFNVLEENFKSAENKTDTQAENEQDNDGDWRE